MAGYFGSNTAGNFLEHDEETNGHLSAEGLMWGLQQLRNVPFHLRPRVGPRMFLPVSTRIGLTINDRTGVRNR